MSKTLDLVNKFRGSLVGAVIGDCIGACFEFETCSLTNILQTVSTIERNREAKRKSGAEYTFTDDTAMARSVAASLINNKSFNAKDMAKRFADEFNREPGRGYGGNVVGVFGLLQNPDLKDIYEPARLQYDGQGSFGNGGSMRIVPAALFSYNKDVPFLEKLTRQITEITHSHYQAIQGAILQCLAVYVALHTDSSKSLDTDSFIEQLKSHMSEIEEKDLAKIQQLSESPYNQEPKRESEKNEKPYCYKLDKIKEYLKRDIDDPVPLEEIIGVLGNDISALGSVPAAVYAFLRASKPFTDEELKDKNGFENTIIYAISFNGDTDTIATMAGAIAGAYYGIDKIPQTWQRSCEGVDDAIKYADQLKGLIEEMK